MWIAILFEPEWFVSSVVGGGALLKRIPTLLLLPLIAVIAQRWRPQAFYWPFALFTLLHIVELPFLRNRGLAMPSMKLLVIYFLLFTATGCIMRDPRRLVFLIRLFLLSMIWFGVQGLASGTVWWHPELGDEDAFGPFMCVGVGMGYYLWQGSRDPRWSRVAMVTAGLATMGVVASFARGALLSTGAVGFVVWLRSPRKARTLGAGIAAVVIVFVAAEIFFPAGAFWNEMATITEGTKSGTGQDRWILWGLGLEVFRDSPILGAGTNNFGAAAVEMVPTDHNRALYRDPGTLYNRALHNNYVQVLSEHGLVGITLYGWMIFDFFRRLRPIRKRARARYWREVTGGMVDLGALARALEAGMVGYLCNAVFYNQIYIHHFWTMLCFGFFLEQYSRLPRGRNRLGSPGNGSPVPD